MSERVEKIKKDIEEFRENNPELQKIVQGMGETPSDVFWAKVQDFINTSSFDNAVLLLLLAAEKLFDRNFRGQGKDLIKSKAAEIYKKRGQYDRQLDMYQYCAEALMNRYKDDGWAGACLKSLLETYTCDRSTSPSEVARRIDEVACQFFEWKPNWARSWLREAMKLYEQAAGLSSSESEREKYLDRVLQIQEITERGIAKYLQVPISIVGSLLRPGRTSYVSRETGGIIEEE